MEEPKERRRAGFWSYLQVVVRRWTLVVSIFSLIFILGVIVTLTSKKVYKATATVKMAIKVPVLTVLPEFTPPSRFYDPMESQIQIIKSRSVGEIAAAMLGLNFEVVYNPDSLRIDSVTLYYQFPSGLYTLFVREDSVIIKNRDGNVVARGQLGRYFEDGGIGIKVVSKVNLNGKLKFRVYDPGYVVDKIKKKISVKHIPQTFVAQITATAEDPEFAARLANAWAKAYVEYTVYDVKRVATQTRRFLENQLALVEKKLNDAEKRLEDFKERTGVIQLDVSTADLVNKIATLEKDKADAETDLRESEMKLAYLKSQLKGVSGSYGVYKKLATSPDVSSNPLVADLRRRLANLETERAKLLEKYTENHPDVLEIDNQIEQIKKEMASVVGKALKETPGASDPVFQTIFQDLIKTETKVNALRGRLDGLNQVLSEYEKRFKDLPATERELARLEREVQTNKNVYDLLSNKLEEAKIAEATKIPEARVIDKALLPLYPSNVGMLRQLLLAALLGIILGVFGAYAMEAIRTTVDVPEEAEEIVGAPILAVIPRIKSTLKPDLPGIRKYLITNLRPKHPAKESYRVLRTNLLLHREKAQQARTVLFTSSQPEEGKSLTAANLAITCALLGDKVLLIDADPRKPVLHEVFDVSNEEGFVDMVSGRITVKPEQVRGIPNLFIIPSGKFREEYEPPLRPEGIDRVLSEVKGLYDLVILDNSPITVGADPIELGNRVDGIILVIKAEKSSGVLLYRVRDMIRKAGLPLLGIVFNGLKPSADYYSSYTRYYGYGYGEEESRGIKQIFKSIRRLLSKKSKR